MLFRTPPFVLKNLLPFFLPGLGGGARAKGEGLMMENERKSSRGGEGGVREFKGGTYVGDGKLFCGEWEIGVCVEGGLFAALCLFLLPHLSYVLHSLSPKSHYTKPSPKRKSTPYAQALPLAPSAFSHPLRMFSNPPPFSLFKHRAVSFFGVARS